MSIPNVTYGHGLFKVKFRLMIYSSNENSPIIYFKENRFTHNTYSTVIIDHWWKTFSK